MDSIQFNEEKIAGFVTLDTFLIRSLNSTIVVSLLRIPDIFTRANLLDRIILFGEIRFAPLPVSLRNTRTPPLSSCLPTPLSLRSTVFDLSLSRSPASLSLARARSLFFLSLSPSRPPVAATRPSLSSPSFVPSSSLVSSPLYPPFVRHRFINSLLLARFCTSTERNLRSSLCAVASYPVWLIARLLLSPSLLNAPLFGLLAASPRPALRVVSLLEIRFPIRISFVLRIKC